MAFGDTLLTTALDADSDSTTGSGNGRDQLLAAVNEVNFILSQFGAGSTPVTTANLVALNVALTNAINTFSEDQLIHKVLPNLLLRTANASDQSFIKTIDDAGVTRAELRVDALAAETKVYLICKSHSNGIARSWIELDALGNVNLETSLSGIATVNDSPIMTAADAFAGKVGQDASWNLNPGGWPTPTLGFTNLYTVTHNLPFGTDYAVTATCTGSAPRFCSLQGVNDGFFELRTFNEAGAAVPTGFNFQLSHNPT